MRRSDAMDQNPGVFTLRSARAIAESMKKSAEASQRRKAGPFQSAMSMLNFEINRGGKGLSLGRRRVLENAKAELRRAFDRPAGLSSRIRPLSAGPWARRQAETANWCRACRRSDCLGCAGNSAQETLCPCACVQHCGNGLGFSILGLNQGLERDCLPVVCRDLPTTAGIAQCPKPVKTAAKAPAGKRRKASQLRAAAAVVAAEPGSIATPWKEYAWIRWRPAAGF